MKKIIAVSFITASLFVLPLALPVGADSTPACQKGTLSVSYSTDKEVSPDTVEFSVSVKTTDKKAMQEASRKNKEISNKIYEYFKANINTAGGDYIKTSNFIYLRIPHQFCPLSNSLGALLRQNLPFQSPLLY